VQAPLIVSLGPIERRLAWPGVDQEQLLHGNAVDRLHGADRVDDACGRGGHRHCGQGSRIASARQDTAADVPDLE
jgi:hypothetical protein